MILATVIAILVVLVIMSCFRMLFWLLPRTPLQWLFLLIIIGAIVVWRAIVH